MKFFIANLLVVCCLFFSTTSYSQLPSCCKGKKVKIKKGKKKRKGALVGVKGHDDKKALKNKMKELKSASKARKQEKKIAAKEEKEIAAGEKKLTAKNEKEESAEEFIESIGIE